MSEIVHHWRGSYTTRRKSGLAPRAFGCVLSKTCRAGEWLQLNTTCVVSMISLCQLKIKLYPRATPMFFCNFRFEITCSHVLASKGVIHVIFRWCATTSCQAIFGRLISVVSFYTVGLSLDHNCILDEKCDLLQLFEESVNVFIQYGPTRVRVSKFSKLKPNTCASATAGLLLVVQICKTNRGISLTWIVSMMRTGYYIFCFHVYCAPKIYRLFCRTSFHTSIALLCLLFHFIGTMDIFAVWKYSWYRLFLDIFLCTVGTLLRCVLEIRSVHNNTNMFFTNRMQT